ncbi:MAG: DNRLRE domain-containing protein [Planctomycetes bacterium]|nr:DNRLRE domain-containing protein [Planctomycetota bacterium]
MSNSLRLLVVVLFGAALTAQTTVWVPCSADNTLYESATGALSNGSGPSLFVGRAGNGLLRRAVLRFDVAAQVPAGAAIVAAGLTVRAVQSSDPTPLPVTGHRLLQAWGEGGSVATSGNGGAGAPAAANDATWLHAFSPSAFWNQAGGDFAAAPSFVLAMPAVGTVSAAPTAAAVADVQAWLDTPAQNHGWLLLADESVSGATARRLDSRESTGVRPFLAVTYVLPGQAGLWGEGCPVGSGRFDLVLVGAPVGGQTMHHVHFGGPPGSVGVFYFALGLEPGGVLLQPDCRLYLPLAQGWVPGNLFVLDGTGTGSSSWTHGTSYPGLYFTTQSAALDGSALGFALSNAGVAVLQ